MSQLDKLVQLKKTLDDEAVSYNIIEDIETVKSAEEGAARGFGSLAVMAPTFILKYENGFLCAIISGTCRISYKKIKKKLGVKNVSLATPEEVEQVTGSRIGTVSLYNPGLRTLIDQRLTEMEHVFGGCGVARHSMRINVPDLIRITGADIFEFTELKS